MGILYLVLPTANSTSDAMGYATGSEIGPHHLLFDQICVWINALCGFVPITTLAVMKGLNAILGMCCLWLVFKVLKDSGVNRTGYWVLLCGACFGFFRFTTENEAYILPLAFALSGIWLFQFFTSTQKMRYLFAGFGCLSLAVLSHQSYVFFYAAFAIGYLFTSYKKTSYWMAVLLPVLVVSAIYWLAAHNNHQILFHWIFQDVHEGLVVLSPGLINFKFTAIGLFRTVFQLHGSLPFLLNAFPIIYAAIALSIFLLIYGVFLAIKTAKLSHFQYPKPLQIGILLAGIFHLIFAWFSVGNAEFMVMLPFLIVLFIAPKIYLTSRALGSIAWAVLLWNLSVFIVPAALVDFENRSAMKAIAHKYQYDIFISHNAIELRNYLELYSDTGKHIPCSNPLPYHIRKSPADAGTGFALPKIKYVYTDCIEYPEPLNRHSMLNGKQNDQFFFPYPKTAVDSFQNFYGMVRIYRIEIQ